MPTRYLKPGIRDSEPLDSVSPMAEVLFYRLLVTVDDFGRFDARPSMIKAHCFPIKDKMTAKICDDLMSELCKAGLISVYEADGKPYMQILKWDNTPRSKVSKYPASADDCMQMYAGVCNPRTVLPVTVTVTETKTETDTKRSPRLAPPDGVSSSVWSDFLAVRKAKKAPMTQAALDGIQREADKAGWALEDALKECCTRGWQSFKAEWVAAKQQTFAQVAADVARVTVPARQGRDPALEKIEQDALAAVKPSPEILARMAALRVSPNTQQQNPASQ